MQLIIVKFKIQISLLFLLFQSFEPANQLKLFSDSFTAQQKVKFEEEGTLMANFYMGDDDKVKKYKVNIKIY